MNVVIIPSHNQAKHIKEIIKGYEQQTILPDVILFVLDRCIDDSKEILDNVQSSLNIQYIEKKEGNNFSAGMTRDCGVSYIEQHFEYSMIVFTDGDCIPSKNLIKEHLENINNTNKALVSCGRRICENEFGAFEDDERNVGEWVNGFGFEKNGRVLLSNKITIENILTYSCNLAFNKKAVELCKQINKEISNSERVFNPEFDGSWGGEDNFISHCLYLTNNWIVLTSNDCFVTHYYHKEAIKNVEYKKRIVSNLSEKLKLKIIEGVIEGEVKVFSKNCNIYVGGLFPISYYSSTIESNIKHKYDKELFDACYTLLYTRVYKFEGYINKRYKGDVEEICEYLTYLKFYLKNNELVFEDDTKDFISKKIDIGYTYSK